MKTLIGIILALAIGAGGYWWYATQTTPAGQDTMPTVGTTKTTEPTSQVTPSDVPFGVGDSSDPAEAAGPVHEITVRSKGIGYEQKTLTVKQGERVRITFQNTGGTHDFRIEGYNIGTKVIQGGQSESFEFIANAAGQFEYFCSVGNHRAMGMWGTLTVEE